MSTFILLFFHFIVCLWHVHTYAPIYAKHRYVLLVLSVWHVRAFLALFFFLVCELFMKSVSGRLSSAFSSNDLKARLQREFRPLRRQFLSVAGDPLGVGHRAACSAHGD